jgi:hypothetical protein
VQNSEYCGTREELLASFRAIQESIKNILERAVRSCGATDLKSAADRMGVLAAGKFLLPDDGWGYAMLLDLALFEANRGGVRPFDRFLAGPARALPEHEQAVARRMSDAFLALFKFTAMHDIGGIWAEDMLNADRRIWIMDEMLQDREATPEIFGARVFDSGPFHVSVGPTANVSDQFIRLCTEARSANGPLPFRRSLAATLYGLNLMDGVPSHVSGLKFARDLLPLLEDMAAEPS